MNRGQQALLMELQLGEKKQGNRNKKNSAFIEYKLYSGINQIVTKWNEKDVEEAADRICIVKSRSFDIYKNQLFPKNIEDLHSGKFTPKELSVERSFNWYTCLIKNYSKEINIYLHLKETFEKNLIVGNYSSAAEALDEIQNTFGFSFWLIDARFSLYEYADGLEKNKEYLDSFVKTDISSWVKFYASFQSFKVEKSVNNRQYVHRIENAFDNDESGIGAFFRALLYPINNIEEDDIRPILHFTSALSLIDMYNALIKISCRLVSSDNKDYKLHLKKALKKVDGVKDVVLTKIKWSMGEKLLWELSEIDLLAFKIGDLYTKGDYSSVIDLIEQEGTLNNNFEIYEYYVKAHIMSNREICKTDSIIIRDQLVYAMYSAYVKKQDVEHSYFIITKLVRLFSNSNLGTMIASFFADKFWDGSHLILEKGKLISSNIFNINLVTYNTDNSEDVFSVFKQTDCKNASYELFQYVVNDVKPNNIEEGRLRWYKIKREIGDDSKIAILHLEEWYSELSLGTSIYNIYQRERVVLELYKLYVQNEDYLKAESLVADVCVDNEYASLRFDLSQIRDAICKKDKAWKCDISTPIFTYLYDKENYTSIYADTANFLFHNGLSKPSDMFGLEKQFGEQKLVFFLKNICVKEILDSMYSAFDTDEDVENERIEICKYLQKKDCKNASMYIEEMSRILQNRKVRQGVKYFEDEKIDISFDKIYDSHKKDFHENYKRYKEMESLNTDFATYDVTKKIWRLDLVDDSQTYSQTFLAFKELIDDYRQEITFGKFGLDPILGARIRHGILQNQIRSVFSKNNIILISKTEGSDKEYVCSLELENIFSNITTEEKEIIIDLLSDFSRKVDDYIDWIVKEYIRIRIDEKNTNGVFDFSINQDIIHILMSVTKTMQNENIVREYLDLVWLGRIENGIDKAKSLMQGIIKNTFIKMLKDLEENINSKLITNNTKDYFLTAISKSRTELQQTMNCISEWFKMPEDNSIDNFSANYLVETCDYINRRVISNYDSIKKEVKLDVKGKFIGKAYTYLVDIFIILYTNAFYHSGFIDSINRLKLELSIIEKEDSVSIMMINNLSEDISKEELYETINDIREKLEECIASGEYYNYEGRSGYIKICKILNYNLECTGSYIEFGLTSDNQNYYIKVELPKNIMVEEEEK